ncbi:cytochrome P450 [Hygrophoropsis aurantiaca]|uniref:Cytochrome P450 n=1 Tax=Hygrophoropsis aurantiaca TaxID=72124 RepID=A0ACB8A236_9AGAM|nr:cytochrome P450 [Hygrophoropsis aurantiaca]
MTDSLRLCITLVVVVSGVILPFYWRRKSWRYCFPPGPRRLPLIGNLLDLPIAQQWLTYAKWGSLYGDMTGIVVLGQPIVIINSFQVALDLLDKRSLLYSDRPAFSLIQTWGGWDWMLTVMQYDEECKMQRRILAQHLNQRSICEYQDCLHEASISFARRLLQKPEKFQDHTRLFAGANIMMITYGHEVRDEEDEWVKLAEAAVRSLDVLTNVGAHPIDLFPVLRHLPRFVFGQTFARQMDNMRHLAKQLITRPYLAVKREIEDGIARSSMASRLIDAPGSTSALFRGANSDSIIQGTLAGAYVAGADTIVSTLDSAILALMLHPEIQREAQRELDFVLMGERLPVFGDREKLPFIDAIFRETLRWNPVAPLAVPHRLIQRDVYDNMIFPAGTTFVANSWQMLHDESVFQEPFAFNPHRFLDANGRLRSDVADPRRIAYGFGRRICPGRHLAEQSAWIAIAMLLSTFELSMPFDEHGNPVQPDLTYVSSLISHPNPFRCVFTPRHKIAHLIPGREDWVGAK